MKPKNKKELIDKANFEFERLMKLIQSLPMEVINAEMEFQDLSGHWQRDKNVRDVITHLYEWNGLLYNWITSNKSGERRSYLPSEYSWSDYSGLNNEFWNKHQMTSLTLGLKLFRRSHKEIIELINCLTEDELFDKSYYAWTENEMLAEYVDETTGNHYLWAIDKIEKHLFNTLNKKRQN
ncbi:MAG: hypothetical protein CVV60_06445 [Tenericutes bacterium HGW-Tenericutes-5]|nr:MAG: hypothetical protein CVV60_06445 [Tenericutes bacterium HGW-Tenericutes-5]